MKKYIIATILLLSSTLNANFNFEECSGSNTFEQHIVHYNGDYENTVLVGMIPQGIQGLHVELISDNDVDIRLYGTNNDKIVHWPHGILKKSSKETKPYKGVDVSYSGYNGINGKKGHESIDVLGSTPTVLTMKAFGYKSGYAQVNYSWTGKEGCNSSKGEGNFTQEIKSKEIALVGTIPSEIDNLIINLNSNVDIDIQLYGEDGVVIVGWPDGLLDGAQKQNIDYHGMHIEWSGYNGVNGEKGHEYIKVTPKTTEKLTMKVYGFRAGYADATYSWGKKTQEKVPAVPTSLLLSSIDTTSVVVTFQDTSNNEDGFKVYDATTNTVIKTLPKMAGTGWAHDGLSNTQRTLSGLTPNTNYTIYIVSHNAAGESIKNSYLNFNTLDTKPQAPSDLSVDNIGTTEATLHFIDNSNNEQGFKIYDMNGSPIETLGVNTNTVTLSNLTINTEYTYYVVAYNAIGESNQSNIVTFKTLPEKPAAPCDLALSDKSTTATSVVLLFQDTSNNEDGFRVYDATTNTVIKTLPKIAGTGWAHDNGGLSDTQRTISGLTPNTNYTIYIVSYNAAGESIKSKYYSFKLDTSLKKPTNLRIKKSARAKSVVLRFSDNSLAETGFKVYTESGILLSTLSEGYGKNGFLRKELTGLTPNTQYHIYVTAYDEESESEKTNTISFKTEVDNKGKIPLLLVMSQYRDMVFKKDEKYWENLIFGDSEGTINHYYNKISYGKFQYTKAQESHGTVNDGIIRVTTSTQPTQYKRWSFDEGPRAEATALADEYIDFSIYDTNHDGKITSGELEIVFLVTGHYTHVHAFKMKGQKTYDGVVYDSLVTIITEHEYKQPKFDIRMGVWAHELGHSTFELPDLYPKGNYAPDILRRNGLMSHGSHGMTPERKELPTHMSGWSKIKSGFVEPTLITESVIGLEVPSAGSNDYKVFKIPTGIPDEYFLIENRDFTKGYDRACATTDDTQGGLLIMHINDQEVGAGIVSVERAFDTIDSAKHLFYKNYKDSFNDASTPNSKRYDGTSSGISIENISKPGEVMTIDIIIDKKQEKKNDG